MIKRAMQALDGHEKAVTSTPEKMNPNIQASLFQGSAVCSCRYGFLISTLSYIHYYYYFCLFKKDAGFRKCES